MRESPKEDLVTPGKKENGNALQREVWSGTRELVENRELGSDVPKDTLH